MVPFPTGWTANPVGNVAQPATNDWLNNAAQFESWSVAGPSQLQAQTVQANNAESKRRQQQNLFIIRGLITIGLAFGLLVVAAVIIPPILRAIAPVALILSFGMMAICYIIKGMEWAVESESGGLVIFGMVFCCGVTHWLVYVVSWHRGADTVMWVWTASIVTVVVAGIFANSTMW